MIKVSVIIPVYNTEKYLSKCLDSLIGQTLREIELICVDDGSTDNSLNILKEYQSKDSRINVIHQDNTGLGAARNTGMNVANGQYIGFVDSDDWVDSDFYEKLYSQAVKYDADIVRASYKYNQDSIEKIGSHVDKYLNEKYEAGLPLEVKHNDTVVWDAIYNRDFLKKNNIMYFDNINPAEDIPFTARAIAFASEMRPAVGTFYHYRKGGENSLSEISLNKIFAQANANLIVADFLNEKNIDINTYMYMFEKIIWRFNYIYKKGLSLKDFTRKQQLKYIELLNFAISKYNGGHSEKILKYKNKYEKIYSDLKNQYKNILNNIFSVKNQNTKKVITICGIKIKLKSKKLQLRQTLQKLNDENKRNRILTREYNKLSEISQDLIKSTLLPVRVNSVLMVEINKCHGEVLVCMIDYFVKLGFNVDIIISNAEYDSNLFSRIKKQDIRIFPMSQKAAIYLLNSGFINDYKYLYFNSDIIYSKKQLTVNIFNNILFDKSKILYMCHHIEDTNNPIYTNEKLMMLAPLQTVKNVTVVNAHRFGVKTLHSKNEVINFIVIGNIDKKRKNYSILINAVQNLLNSNIKNFRITVIARFGTLEDIPKDIQPYIDFKGRLNYDDMWNEMEKADFFLTLLDPENPEHDRYITVGSSGSFQLIYGFRTPAVIAEKFAQLHSFNSANSIIYKNNSDLGFVMAQAIKMNNDEYMEMVKNLEATANQIYEKSLQNLKDLLK